MTEAPDIEKEAKQRFADAKAHKEKFSSDLEEAYYFTVPTRQRQMSGAFRSEQRPEDQATLSTSIGIECAEDLATLAIATYFPDSENWAKRELSEALSGGPLSQEEAEQLNEIITTSDRAVFDAIRASNVMTEIAKVFTPDFAIGTVALHVDPAPKGSAILAMGVTLPELFLNIGPDGTVDDRFIERSTTARRLPGLIRGLGKMTKDAAKRWAKKAVEAPTTKCCVRWGWWRDWDADVETWTWVLMVNNDLIDSGSVTGVGSCPLIVGRMGASPEWAFAQGPTLKSLPELRTADEVSALLVETIDHSIKPASSYPVNSIGAVENGVESGAFYPVEAGEGDDIKPLYKPESLQPAYFDLDIRERKIKRLHYVDKPEQRGDTPPTLGQWMSEIEMGQRRFGVPGKVFWSELPRGIFLRFLFLLEQRGTVKKVKFRDQDVILSAVNPAQRAQDMQEVTNAARAIEIGGGSFPEEFKVAVDGAATFKNIVEKLGASRIIVFRKPGEIKKAIENITPLIGGQTPGVAPSPGLLNPAQGLT